MQIKNESDENLSDIVTKLRTHFGPVKIFLFGSRANDAFNEDSDYDLLIVVKDSDKNSADRIREASQVLWGRKYSVDLIVLTEEEFSRAKNEAGSIVHQAVTKGMEL